MTISRNRLPKHIFKLHSPFTALLAILLYTVIFFSFLKTPSADLASISTSFSFSSTDLNDPVRASLEDLILDAKTSVTIIIYSLADTTILKALKTASDRNVKVTIVYDSVETGEEISSLGKRPKYAPFRAKGLMHNKLVVIDHTYVWTGSANLSTKSLTSQGNLVLTISCKPLAERIEELADHLVRKKTYTNPPLELALPDQTTTIFFHPYHGRQSLRLLIDRINAAKNRIFAAMFTFTNKEIATALALAKARGVDVRVIFDRDSCKQTSKKIFRFLKSRQIPCGYQKKAGLLHYKTALIDNALFTGSCNWTQAAFSENCETVLAIEPLLPNQEQWIKKWWDTVESSSTIPHEK